MTAGRAADTTISKEHEKLVGTPNYSDAAK